MLKDIRIYLMQRLFAMNQKATNLDDYICPSIRKGIDRLKVNQKYWVVYASGFQEFEVMKAYDGFGVNLKERTCSCKWWNLSGIPCVHVVDVYSFLNQDTTVGVSNRLWKLGSPLDIVVEGLMLNVPNEGSI
ncbi:agenet domain-containing protein [Tanacetum coccineum]